MLKLSNFFAISLENFVNKIFNQTQYGSLLVHFPSGQLKIYKGNKEGVSADIKFNNFLVVSKFLKKGTVGFAESYMDEDFTTTNLKNLLIFTEINKSGYLDFQKGNWFYRFVSKAGHYLNQNTISKSKKNISYHYDLGNNFYELWLDETMTYSSGLFNAEKDNLLEAQMNKYILYTSIKFDIYVQMDKRQILKIYINY